MSFAWPRQFTRLPTILLLSCAAAACGGGGGGSDGKDPDDDGTTTNSVPSLGLIRNAVVNLYRADSPECPTDCPLLASGNTGSDGIINSTISDYRGPMVIEVLGGGSAEYFDESANRYRPFPAPQALRALTPSARGQFGVTILTELAYQGALIGEHFPLNASKVNSLNNTVKEALAPELNTILTPPVLIDRRTEPGSLGNNNGSLYAIKLAALAELGAGKSSPALAVLNALVADLQDGTIDGLNNGVALVPAAPYNPGTFADDLSAAMTDFANTLGNTALKNRIATLDSSLQLSLFPNPDNGGDGDGDGDGGGDSDPIDESPDLGLNNGITGIFAGVRRTSTEISAFDGPPVSLGVARIEVGADLDPFRVALRQIIASQGATRECASNGVPSLFVTLDSIEYSGSPAEGGSCTIIITELTNNHIRGTFSGTLAAFEQAPLIITDGEFQYFLDLFPDGDGLPAVRASFEGLTTGVTINGQGSGAGDVGWQGLWTAPSVTLDNVSSAPLAVTPGSGSELAGGDTAAKIRSTSFINDGRDLDKMFNNDVYISALFRIEEGAGGTTKSMITLGNASLFIGVDDSYDVSIADFREQQFFVSMGDEDAQRAWGGGRIVGDQTYHLVGRLRKEGADTYNRFDLWVDPDIGDAAVPHATASRTQGTGSQKVIRRIGFRSFNQLRDLHIDRIQLSDRWAGVFADPAEEPEIPETGTCGIGATGANLIGSCAGTYNVAFVHRDGSHSRGTVIIGADNSIDFDSGISFSSAEATSATVTNRFGFSNRLDIEYSSGDKIVLYRTSTGALRNVHYQPDDATDNDAIKVSFLSQLPASTGNDSLLTGNNIISGTVNGVPRIQDTIPTGASPVRGPFGTFEIRGQNHMGDTVDTVWTITDIPSALGTHYCEPFDFATQITFGQVSLPGAAQSGGGSNTIGRCTITVLELDMSGDSVIGAEGKFAVELLSTGPDGTGNLVDIVTDGYFRYRP